MSNDKGALPFFRIPKDADECLKNVNTVTVKVNDLIDRFDNDGAINGEVDVPIPAPLHDVLEKLCQQKLPEKLVITFQIKLPKK